MLVDTHAHIHFESYPDVAAVVDRARLAGVGLIVTVGTDEVNSAHAIELAARFDRVYPTVGLHPHDAKPTDEAIDRIRQLATDRSVAAIGECGLDYFKNFSAPDDQIRVFRAQVEIALANNLPMIWHVREAFDDFFKIVDQYQGLTGIVHSFTDNRERMEQIVERGFKLGFNGIMTFTKDEAQLEAAKLAPLDSIVVETDCPWLTPSPHRGQRNEPAHVELVAKFLAELRGESFDDFAAVTTKNAQAALRLKAS
jgi:TatD DNase family protein